MAPNRRRHLLSLCLAVAFPGLAPVRGANPPPFDPTLFEIDPQLQITRWAAEPEVVDPVALCFDEAGRAYVAECRDYPNGAGPDGAVNSTIRLLEDLDGDGVPDRSTVFADKLSYATSVTCWRGGILVAAAPDILFLKDTDGDGKADVREVVLTGFKRGVSDSLVNGLRFHLDGRIHGANGGNGGVITSPRWRGVDLEQGPVDLRNHDFAFQPDTGTLDLTTQSSGGFGLVFDDYGHKFTTHNINHLQYCFLPRRYAEHYEGVSAEFLTVSISDHGEMSRLFPVSEARTRPNHPEQAGHFSAAGGMGYVGSGRWPFPFYGSVLVCDVVGNLVHRDQLRDTVAGFEASRGTNELTREFLASKDAEFRPVGLESGPDGALYLVAMQRTVIEHPDYIPAAVRARQDLRAGSDRGRIYRLAPNSGLPAVKVDLGQLKNVELVPYLAHDDQWWRTTAQRLLVERHATDAAAALRGLARDARIPLGRLHALWTLNDLGECTTADLAAALKDGNPNVRENALLVAEPRIGTAPSIGQLVLGMLIDPSPRVRYQAILTAGIGSGERATGPFTQLLRLQAGDARVRRAILTSFAPSDLGTVLEIYLRDRQSAMIHTGPMLEVFRELAELIGARAEARPVDFENVFKRLDLGLSETVRTTLLTALLTGLERSGAKPKLSSSGLTALTGLIPRAPESRLPVVWRLLRRCGLPDPAALLGKVPGAIAGATNSGAALTNRLVYLKLAGLDPGPGGRAALLQCLTGTELPEIQNAALAELHRGAYAELGADLLKHWRALGPTVRPQVLGLLLSRRLWLGAIIEAWEQGAVTVGELNLDLEQRRRILNDAPEAIRPRVKNFIGDGEYANRAGIVNEWLATLPARGDSTAGRKLFEADCAKCHRAGGLGRNVGPDLSGVAHRSVEDLLANILDPNMAINPGFVAYVAETRSGEIQTGLLVSQDSTSINLLQAEEHIVVVPRRDLLKLESSGKSLMPVGLEQGKTPQDLRNLIAFLQGRN